MSAAIDIVVEPSATQVLRRLYDAKRRAKRATPAAKRFNVSPTSVVIAMSCRHKTVALARRINTQTSENLPTYFEFEGLLMTHSRHSAAHQIAGSAPH